MSDGELVVVKFLLGRFFVDGGVEGNKFVVLKVFLDDGSELRRRMLEVWFDGGRLCLRFFGFCDDFEVVDRLGLVTGGASNRGFKPDGCMFGGVVVGVQVDLFSVGDFVGLRDVIIGGLVACEGCVFPDVSWLGVLRDRFRLLGVGV